MGIKVEDWLDWQIEEFRKHPHDDCIPWPFSKGSFGHGKFGRNGKTVGAHRDAYEKYYGIPLEGIGRHTCDTPACINPLHVVDGTRLDNSEDMIERGRQSSTLTEDEVKEILRLLAKGKRVTKLASQFGVANGTISMIKTGRTWRHIPRPWDSAPPLRDRLEAVWQAMRELVKPSMVDSDGHRLPRPEEG